MLILTRPVYSSTEERNDQEIILTIPPNTEPVTITLRLVAMFKNGTGKIGIIADREACRIVRSEIVLKDTGELRGGLDS